MKSQAWARTLLLALPLFILSACTSTPRVDNKQSAATTAISPLDALNNLIAQASLAQEPQRSKLYLQAAGKLADLDQKRTSNLLSLISEDALSSLEKEEFKLVQAHLSIASNNTKDADAWLSLVSYNSLPAQQQLKYDTLKAELADLEGDHALAVASWGRAIQNPKSEPPIYGLLWQSLLQLNNDELAPLTANNTNTALQPWLELITIYRSPSELSQQLEELKLWQKKWQGTEAWKNTPATITALQETAPYQPRKIALLLPLSGRQSGAGNAVRDGFMASYFAALAQNPDQPEITLYDTEGADAATLAQQAQNEGAELLIGPLRRSVAREALQALQSKQAPANTHTTLTQDNALVPTNAEPLQANLQPAPPAGVTVPWLVLNQVSDETFPEPVYQFALSSESEAEQAAERAWNDGYRHPVIMNPDSNWGLRVANSFQKKWNELGGETLSNYTFNAKNDYNKAVSEALLVNTSFKRANTLSGMLGQSLDYTPRRREDIDMLFIVGSPSQGRQLKPALDFYFAYNLPVYTVSTMFSGESNRTLDRDLNDIRIPLMPWFVEKNLPLRSNIQKLWKESRSQLAPLYALGVDAWRLYPRMEQMARSEGAQLFGATGILTITPNRDVQRTLKWQHFSNGHPAPLSREMSLNPNSGNNVLDNEDS